VVDETLPLDVRWRGAGIVVVTARGEIDLVTAPALAQRLEQHLPSSGELVLDLSEVAFFGAAGLQALVHVQREATRHGIIFRLVTGPQVHRLLGLVELDRTLLVHDAR